jgi:DNA-binding XRE family transcriptional regulator
MSLISPVQIRMARAALDLSARELAQLTGLALSTCLHAEKGDALASTLNTLVKTFERRGINFTRSGIEVANGGDRYARELARADDRERFAAAI